MMYCIDNIDMSIVQCSYEQEQYYIYIKDEYTNNILQLAGYKDISEDDYEYILVKDIFRNYHREYALKSAKNAFIYSRDVIRGRFVEAEKIIATDSIYSYKYANYV